MQVGELSGSIDAMLNRIATDLENEHALRQRLFLATFISKYILLPLLLLVPNTPNIMMHGLNGLEKADGGLSQHEQQGIILREGLKGYFHDLMAQLLPLVIIAAILYVAFRLMSSTHVGRRILDKIALLIPVTGHLWRDLAISRYLTALSLLSKAGLPPAPALEACANLSGNIVLDEKFQSAACRARQHNLSISDALMPTGIFSDTALSLMRTGEHTGTSPEMFQRAAAYYEADVQNRMTSAPKIVGVLCFSICGLATAIVVGNAARQYFDNIFPAVEKFMDMK